MTIATETTDTETTNATQAPPFRLSDRAARRIAAIVAKEEDASALRVSVSGGGCSGFQYEFGFAAGPEDGDWVIERDGAMVLIDTVSQPFLAGSELDFVDELLGAHFKVINPQATANCGCGVSFSI